MDVNLFSEGSIYYYINKTNTKDDYYNDSINHDFLVSRPVYVLKSNQTPFESFTINVLAITSSPHRIGIPININGFIDGKILPYAIHSVHTDNLSKYMGKASDEIIQTVSQAVKYHQAYTDEVPKYIQEYNEYMERVNKKLQDMSIKEKGVYLFIKDICEHKPSNTILYDELFNEYKKYTNNAEYTRTQDFSKVLRHHISDFPNVEIKIENKITYIRGLAMPSNLKNKPTKKEGNQTKRVISDNRKMYDTIVDNSQLYPKLTKKAKTIYDKLDIVQKISNYYKDYRNLDISELLNEEDKLIMKRMIVNDVNTKKEKILRRLANGESPLNMKTTDQYVVYICTTTELSKNISKKYLQHNSVQSIKKHIKKNIKHFFVKVNM